MRTHWLAPIALVSTVVWGQSTVGPFFVKNEVGRVGVETSLRADPPSSPVGRIFAASSRGRSITNGPTFYSRILLDKGNHAYLGYELLIEQRQPGEYLATFGKLGVTPLDLAAGSIPATPPSADVQSPIDLAWKLLPLPLVPPPRVLHDGDILSIELFADAATGDKLIDDIRINPPRPAPGPAPMMVPTAAGDARDFLVGDAELQIVQPRMSLNRTVQVASGPGFRNVHGGLVWLYLPEHGRFVLSLIPRAALGFKKVGEVRGGLMTFTLDNDSIQLECLSPIATGNSAYHLYVFHDPDWEPTAERQKYWPALGTVGAGELAALKRH